MFGIGSTELMIILVFGFLLFGPDKLPQMGRTIGRALRQFRETQERMTSMVQSEVIDPMAAAVENPSKPKKAASKETDEDADAEDTQGPQRKETFAERRARLAAEKAEREAAAGEGAAAEGTPAPEGADTPEPAAEQVEPEPETEPAVRTTADLYARRPRKRPAASGSETPVSPTATDASAAPSGGASEEDSGSVEPVATPEAPASEDAPAEGGER
ncbi:Sec-independent protein translocase subunit TatA/TatB [Collinsella vaginalis]|uniref:Sec-independent protein translocase subunit TatA/TatB n=1 Tax=Collinsella vaginalis TaxID=1870987 RepID=UPI000A26A60E|nr:twin-arginine translocase TatA/TatE family subunit [Collinsella vaginalis]